MKSIVLLSLLCSLLSCIAAISVMSVDFGSAFIKVGIVSRGVPIDLALNTESKRKTQAAIAIRDGKRLFGEKAVVNGLRFPGATFRYLLLLLGRPLAHDAVDRFRRRFPHYQLLADEERGTVMLKHDDGQIFSVEELISMQLSDARAMASLHSGDKVTDAVIVVPAYFGQAERRAMLAAAQLAGIKPLQLMNDNAAVALNYGMFRRSDFNTTMYYIMFFDVGASSSSATVVGYHQVKTKEGTFVETNPQLKVLGYSYDTTLSGLEMTLRLRDHLASSFMKSSKNTGDIYKNQRAMSKLFAEADRVKVILSANTETYAQVERLVDDDNFKLLVTREEFEKLCEDLMPRVSVLLQRAAESAALTLSDMNELMLMGGSSRVPLLQEVLQKQWGDRPLSRSINADEAAALGAVYRAADLSTGFRVKRFHVQDRVHLPIVVDFERELSSTQDESEGVSDATRFRVVRRNLFPVNNLYPQKKVITFNKNTEDFHFDVNYGDLSHLSEDQISDVVGLNLTHVILNGVTAAHQQHMDKEVPVAAASSAAESTADNPDAAQPKTESRGVKVHFRLDDSGLLSLVNAEVVFDKPGTDAADDADDSTLSKLTNAFSKIFSSGEPEGNSTDIPPSDEVPVTESSINESSTTTTTPSSSSEDTTSNTSSTVTDTKKPAIRTVKVSIQPEQRNTNVPEISQSALEMSQKKIAEMDERDRQRERRERSRNALESELSEARARLYRDEYQQASTEQERETITDTASQLSDWLYEEGFDEGADVYEKKSAEFAKLTKGLYNRVQEHSQRQEMVDTLKSVLNMTQTQFLPAIEVAVQSTALTESDAATLQRLYNNTQEWLDKKLSEQKNTPLTEKPKLTLAAMAEKVQAIDREVKYLTTRIKIGQARVAKEEADKRLREQLEKIKAESLNTSTSDNTTESDSTEDTTASPDDAATNQSQTDGVHTEL